jgi:PAS domain S-box-containing protein
MRKSLRVLILEDSQTDTLLLLRELQRNGYEVDHRRADNAADMITALDDQAWDIILSDFSMPGFDALVALTIVRKQHLDTPFIIVSGTMGEETAVTAMKAGANDFFPKSNIKRLVPAIEREIQEADERRQRRLAERQLRQAEERFARAFESSPTGIVVSRLSDGRVLDANPRFLASMGYQRDEVIGRNGSELNLWVNPDQRLHVVELIRDQGSVSNLEVELQLASGKRGYALLSAELIEIEGERCILSMVHDITERKEAAQQVQRYTKRLELLHDIDQAILSAQSPEAIAQSVLERLRLLIPYDGASVDVFDLENHEGAIIASTMTDQGGLDIGYRFPLADVPHREQLRRNHPYIVNDLKTITEPTQIERAFIAAGVGSYASIPLISSERRLGSLNFFSDKLGAFLPWQLEVATEVAAQLAIALENARLLETEQRRNAELTALHQASLQLTSSLDLERVLDTILDYAILLINADNAHIFLFDGQSLTFGAAQWDGQKQNKPIAEPRQGGLTHTVARSGKQVIVSHVNEHPLYRDWQWDGAIIGLPLRVTDSINGVMSLGFKIPHHFDATEVRIVELLADQAAIAIHNAQLYQRIQQHADELEQRVAERTLELRQQKERIEAILRDSMDAIVLLRSSGVIELANPAFCTIFGYTSDEIRGASLAETIQFEQIEVVLQALQNVAQSRAAQRLELTVHHADGTAFEADVILSPVKNHEGGHSEIICSLRDITRLKQVEAELRHALEKEKELNQLKSNFTSMVSHEFRTPLAVISSSKDLLARYFDRLAEDDRQRHLQKIEDQVRYLIRLMDDVLLIGRSESTGLTFNPQQLNLADLCESIIEEVRVGYDEGITIDFMTDGACASAFVDANLFHHILQNLLSNALKYSPAQSAVQIRLTCSANIIVLSVKDEGIGIPAEDQQKLFEAFYRADNVGTIQGTGLGLSIVKRAVDTHQGTVEFESAEGKGTVFIVNLPNNRGSGSDASQQNNAQT